jgi:hypothetical protein
MHLYWYEYGQGFEATGVQVEQQVPFRSLFPQMPHTKAIFSGLWSSGCTLLSLRCEKTDTSAVEAAASRCM